MSNQRKAKTVPANRLSTYVMGSDPEKKGLPTIVIDGDEVKEYVGIGWITLRKASRRDKALLPVVTR